MERVSQKNNKKHIEELEILNKISDEETLFTMLASEDVLKKEWDNELDERWNTI